MEKETFLNIQRKSEINELLKTLKSDTPALFGTMTAQHMVEHLYLTLELSTGKRELSLAIPVEKAERMKAVVIHTEQPLAVGFKSPIMPKEGLLALMNVSLASAVRQLESCMDEFGAYFKKNQGAKLVHPSFGELGYEEWLVFHNKHFTHHFRQFGLV